MNRFMLRLCFGLLLVALAAAGCGEPADLTAPPEGWETANGRWWQAGVDTSTAFRDLSSLEAMGLVDEATYAAVGEPMTGEQFAQGVKRSVLPLYRHQPQVVDSVFEAYVLPEMQGMEDEGPDVLREEAYTLLRNHVTEPREVLQLGEDIPVAYPDSLRDRGRVAVRMQVRLNAEGEPLAVELLEGGHPTLGAIALRAATQMRWQPMQMTTDGAEEPIPSWVRYSVVFRVPSAP